MTDISRIDRLIKGAANLKNGPERVINKMKVITFRLYEQEIAMIDKMVKSQKTEKVYTTRSEFIREAVLDKIKKEGKNLEIE